MLHNDRATLLLGKETFFPIRNNVLVIDIPSLLGASLVACRFAVSRNVGSVHLPSSATLLCVGRDSPRRPSILLRHIVCHYLSQESVFVVKDRVEAFLTSHEHEHVWLDG
jgi:hypothetical protein